MLADTPTIIPMQIEGPEANSSIIDVVNFVKKLRHGAVIGYVQSYDFHYWQRTIDGWIDELIAGKISSCTHWSEKDKLQSLNRTSSTAKYRSENSRQKDNIILFHLWVNLSIK